MWNVNEGTGQECKWKNGERIGIRILELAAIGAIVCSSFFLQMTKWMPELWVDLSTAAVQEIHGDLNLRDPVATDSNCRDYGEPFRANTWCPKLLTYERNPHKQQTQSEHSQYIRQQGNYWEKRWDLEKRFLKDRS